MRRLLPLRAAAFYLLASLLLSPVLAQEAATPFETLSLNSLDAFEATTSNWQIMGSVTVDRNTEQVIEVKPGRGVLVNRPSEDLLGHLFTSWEHSDIELDLEVLMPVGSNSGIYFQGRYEIQLFDSWGVKEPSHSDLGGIYQRWDESRPEGEKGFEGHAPRVNVARAPGLWQHLNIVFRAPRFDPSGNKVEDAQFVSVALNGIVIHEQVDVTGPTRSAAFEEDETDRAPIMIQGDHGPVAFRNIRYRLFDNQQVSVSDLSYKYYEGEFPYQMPVLADLNLIREEPAEEITAELADADRQFALRFEGTLDVPKNGRYTFEVAHSTRFRLELDGEEILNDDTENIAGVGEFSRHRVYRQLTAGNHAFALTYAKGLWHSVPTALGWYVSGPGLLRKELTAPGSLPDDAYSSYRLDPEAEPIIQRNFVVHHGEKRTHALSVGFPGGLHYSYDLGSGALLHLWKGEFIDTSTMWYQRGEMQSAVPLGSVVVRSGKPAVARLTSAADTWPLDAAAFEFHQYRLDAHGIPTYSYSLGDMTVSDRLEPDADQTHFIRTLTIENQGASEAGAWVLLAESSSIEPYKAGAFFIDDQSMSIEFEESQQAQVRSADGVQQLVLPVAFSNGLATVQYRLIW